MPVCTATDCKGDAQPGRSLCTDHFEQARAYYMAQYQLRLQPAIDAPRRAAPPSVIFDRDFFSRYHG